jgi:hypothetical protein
MFFLLFLLDDRRIRIRIHVSDYWIRMRIREALKHMDLDSTDPDPDPQHRNVCILRVAYITSSFCRSRLSVLNEKLTSLERKVDYLEARVAKAGESPN